MKKSSTKETVIFLIVFVAVFALFAIPMGLANMLNTLMNTAYSLLMDTTFYLLAISVLAGAIASLFSEFGVIDLLNKLLSPLMKPLYQMPGAAALGIVTTYLSDNPAILTLADDTNYRRFFKKYQIPALTNLGTSFGMGLVVSTFMLGLGSKIGAGVGLAVVCGNIGAICGSIVSCRLMLFFTAKEYGREAKADVVISDTKQTDDTQKERRIWLRVMNALMDGGSKGVNIGLSIIPGVLIICTIIMMLTNGPGEAGIYTGAAYEGIELLPFLASKINFILQPLFGFTSIENIAVPVTALGSAGASLGIVSTLVSNGLAHLNDIAVFTAMCMCWSGYLSTHVSMMDVLKCNSFTDKAILSHTIGGLVAGISAHWLFVLISML